MTSPDHVPISTRRGLAALLLFVGGACAQSWTPEPAEQLRALEPFVGSWRGEGEMIEPGGVRTPWTSRSTYRWALDGHFLQEDFTITMRGIETPMVFRSYVGWDRDRGRYVRAQASSDGVVALDEVHLLDGGVMLTVKTRYQAGLPYHERSRVVVDGDAMKVAVDMLMHEGASMRVIDGRLDRVEASFDGAWDTPPWMDAAPAAPMRRLARMAGDYETKGQMASGPGAPMAEVALRDRWQMAFGGTVMHCRTVGALAGAGGAYQSHAFWAHDARDRRLRAVYVDNMGLIGVMDGWWHRDAVVSTQSGLSMGAPTAQRYVIHVDEDGAAAWCEGHTTSGVQAPFLSFRTTFEKRGEK